MLASQIINWKLPGTGFSIVGIETQPHMMGNQSCEGLVWDSLTVPKPTEEDLAAWEVEYNEFMADQFRIANRNWTQFGQQILGDQGIILKAFQTHPNAWFLLVDLLRRPIESLEAYQMAIQLVRLNMPVDLDAGEIDRLNAYAADAGIDLEIPYTY
jgi:hypothetical protein